MSFFEKGFKKRFFSSIRTKFVIVYVLVNIISLQLIGLFFTTQLRNSNVHTFEQNIIEQEKILTHLASLQFTRNEVHHPISQLSGGQKAKLLLLKMVLDQANVLLLDEPTRNFSPTSQPQIRKLFTSYTGAFITVSHDRTFLKEVCQKIYHLTETGLEQVRKEQL